MPHLNINLRQILQLCIERQIDHNTHFASNNHVLYKSIGTADDLMV